MDPVINVTAQDLIEVASPDQGSASGYITGKESLAQVGNFIASGISYAGLPTSDQTLTGAIAELDGDRATLSESITDAYDNTATYDVGDFCIYENTLYKCNTAIATPEDFDSTKWTQTTIMAEAGGSGGLRNYSTTEKVVGTWINGKPIYEKSFVFTNITIQAGNAYEIQTSTLNLDYEQWVGFECVSTTNNIVLNCNYYGTFEPYGWSASVADDVIAFTRGTAGAITSDYVVTLRYTKTTD